MARLLALCCLLVHLGALGAPSSDEAVRHIALQLRCLVCQNQSVADSQSALAVDFRRQIATLLAQGRSEQQVLDHLVERYGHAVRYQPAFMPATWALWLGPFVLLLAGLGALAWQVHRRRPRRRSLS
jgi:cytochrome c-type biogenesis protein CcmH